MAGPAVEVCGRVPGLLLDIIVEVLEGLFEALREEIGHAAREIHADLSRPQLDCPAEVAERGVVVAETALRDRPVVVAVGEHGVEADGGIEIRLRAAKVAEVVFRDAAEEETPVVRGVQPREDVEILDGLGVPAVGQGLASPPHEDILVVLGEGESCSEKQQGHGQEKLFHYFCKDNQ